MAYRNRNSLVDKWIFLGYNVDTEFHYLKIVYYQNLDKITDYNYFQHETRFLFQAILLANLIQFFICFIKFVIPPFMKS
jgi:hypothetical protein